MPLTWTIEKKTHRHKKGEISLPGAAAKGAKPIRDLYKVNETRLFDHVRGNICLPDWGSPSKDSTKSSS